MPEFRYTEPFLFEGPDLTKYQSLGREHVSLVQVDGHEVLRVAPQALTLLAREAFREIAFFYRERHLRQVAAILDDPEARWPQANWAVGLRAGRLPRWCRQREVDDTVRSS